MGWLIG